MVGQGVLPDPAHWIVVLPLLSTVFEVLSKPPAPPPDVTRIYHAFETDGIVRDRNIAMAILPTIFCPSLFFICIYEMRYSAQLLPAFPVQLFEESVAVLI